MKASRMFKNGTVALALLASAAWSASALAGSLVLQLQRSNLTNVADAAGSWQHEGGTILKGAAAVGRYAITRRVTTGGTTAQNTAMTTVTLFFTTGLAVGNAPENVTIQGSHGFTTGNFRGSVGAASNRYNWLQGADVTYAPTATAGLSSLVLIWTGANQLTLP